MSPESADILRILFMGFVILLVFGAGRGGSSPNLPRVSIREIIMKWKKEDEDKRK